MEVNIIKKLKGNLIFWEISELNVSKEELSRRLETIEDFDDFVPRNDYKTAAIRAIRHLIKGDDRFYRRVMESKEKVSFAVVLPEVTNSDVSFKKEVVVSLDKQGGAVFFDCDFEGKEQFLNVYKECCKTLDSNQFRQLVLRIVREKCAGVSMRKMGGIYYVNSDHFSHLGLLKEVFKLFPLNAKMHEVPIYDDVETKDALEVAIHDDITSDIDGLIKDLKDRVESDGNLKERIVKNRQDNIDTLLGRVRTHEDDLRSKAELLRDRINKVNSLLKKCTEGRPFNLADSLALL